jgi:CPA1 family monovalent cation:H+ antiporter
MAGADDTCPHLTDDVDPAPAPRTPEGCEECLAAGGIWVHLRLCLACGHVGCCDNSPGRHATGHYNAAGHPLIRSYEPGEDWFYCFVDDAGYLIDGAPPAPSHA